MNKAIIVNLFGAPGAGKSTGAAYIFSQLKMRGFNAELVTEYAKDKVWEADPEVFKNQAYIFGKQYFRISRCSEKVDVIITDSPLFLSIMYNQESNAQYRMPKSFETFVLEVFKNYHNINYLVERNKPYNPIGRMQTEAESNSLNNKLQQLLNDYQISFQKVKGNIDNYNNIVEEIIAEIYK